MFTSKERSHLRSLASTMQPVMQIGKGGITDNLINSLSEALEARELIKVTVFDSAEADADTIAQNVADLLHAEVVTVVGKKAVFYRRSSRKNFNHISF